MKWVGLALQVLGGGITIVGLVSSHRRLFAGMGWFAASLRSYRRPAIDLHIHDLTTPTALGEPTLTADELGRIAAQLDALQRAVEAHLQALANLRKRTDADRLRLDELETAIETAASEVPAKVYGEKGADLQWAALGVFVAVIGTVVSGVWG